MTLEPLLSASVAIQIHAFAAMTAFVLGLVQFVAPSCRRRASSAKGTLPHRTIGWIWAGFMLTVSITAFFIHEIRLWGQWSPIHLLAVFILIQLPIAIRYARRHAVVLEARLRQEGHRRAMMGLFLGALVIAGLFTLFPGRIMHGVVFGP